MNEWVTVGPDLKFGCLSQRTVTLSPPTSVGRSALSLTATVHCSLSAQSSFVCWFVRSFVAYSQRNDDDDNDDNDDSDDNNDDNDDDDDDNNDNDDGDDDDDDDDNYEDDNDNYKDDNDDNDQQQRPQHFTVKRRTAHW